MSSHLEALFRDLGKLLIWQQIPNHFTHLRHGLTWWSNVHPTPIRHLLRFLTCSEDERYTSTSNPMNFLHTPPIIPLNAWFCEAFPSLGEMCDGVRTLRLILVDEIDICNHGIRGLEEYRLPWAKGGESGVLLRFHPHIPVCVRSSCGWVYLVPNGSPLLEQLAYFRMFYASYTMVTTYNNDLNHPPAYQ